MSLRSVFATNSNGCGRLNKKENDDNKKDSSSLCCEEEMSQI